MDKEKFYNKIQIWIYRKFDELEVSESSDGTIICLRYKDNAYIQVSIEKTYNQIIYNAAFRDNISKQIRLQKRDFETLLSNWIKKTFKMKVAAIIPGYTGTLCY